MNHLHTTDMNYLQHMVRALKMSARMLLGSALTLVHAFLPWILANAATSALDDCEELLIVKKK
jgi:hypothetical protein